MTSGIHSILKKYWGYDFFRPLQEEIIKSCLDHKDVLALLPTGGGKSICFQVPALSMDGLCLVVSPLIALMKDQVEGLSAKGIPALYIHAGMNYNEVKQILKNVAYGNFKFLYVSPERIKTDLFLEFLPALKLSLLAIDEAHCISQWGYDFRPSYLEIASLRDRIPSVPCIALTASATPLVQEDICKQLRYHDAAIFRQSFIRPELSYSVFNPPAKQTKLAEILRNVPGSSIVYCKSRKQTQVIASNLRQLGLDAEFYHAGLTPGQRSERQENWIENRCRIIVCTNAFGMGIDKPDVRTVIHYDPPDCIENYYQEAGRAGRDGKRAYAILFIEPDSPENLISRVDARYPSSEEIKKVYISLMNYLQVAAGGGEGSHFDFDIDIFCRNFSLDPYLTTYAIDIMVKLDIFSLPDSNFQKSQLVFSCSKEDIQDYEKLNPEADPVIKALLRTYEGIFNYPSTINEKFLSKFSGVDYNQLISELQKLHRYGLVSYNQGSEKQQIILLRNRMYEDDYIIREETIRRQHKIALERAASIIEYFKTGTCRNTFISKYFGDTNSNECGICDNCISERDKKLQLGQFSDIKNKLVELIKTRPMTPADLISKIPEVENKILWNVLEILQQEEVLQSDGYGNLELRKKT